MAGAVQSAAPTLPKGSWAAGGTRWPQPLRPAPHSYLRAHPETLATLVATIGLTVQVMGYAQGWSGRESVAITLWYLGLVAIVAPFAWLLLAAHRTGRQRLGSSVTFVLLLTASQVLASPIVSRRFDETLHVSTLVTMVDGKGFFLPNTMLPISPHYPGLELATSGVYWLTGLPLFVCQLIVVLTARVALVTALFLLASRVARSTRAGSVVVLLYAASPQFYVFNAMYSYQTVAIACQVAGLYLMVRAFDSRRERPWKELVAIQLCFGALVITHHITSWLTLAALWALVLVFWWSGDRRRFSVSLLTAELSTIVMAAWTAVIAPLLISYLVPTFEVAREQLVAALSDGGGRQIGVASDGSAAPTWQIMLMAGSVLLWLALLLPATYWGLRGRTVGSSRARFLLLGVAALYPFLHLARLSPTAGEISDRASTFILMALALVVGAWVARRVHRWRPLVVPGAVVLILGGTLIGSGPDWQRVPGPWLPGADQRSVDATTLSVAQWAGRYLPDDSRVAADLTFSRVLPNYSPVVAVASPRFDSMTPLFVSESLTQESLRLILRNDVDFVVVDTRLVGRTAKSGGFFDGGAGYGPGGVTVQPAQVEQFEDQQGFDLVLDGPVKVYDVRSLRGEAITFADRDPPGLPGGWVPWQVCATALLLLGLGLRRRALNPRLFRARDMWVVASILPVAMGLGALGLVVGFPPAGGLLFLAALVAVALVGVPASPSQVPPLSDPRARPWILCVAAILVASIAVAAWSSQRGLFDTPALPPPVIEVGA